MKPYSKLQLKKASAITTHIFAVAHGAVAFALANTVIGDKPFLTILTVLLILTLSKINGSDVSHLFKSILMFSAFIFGSTMAFAIFTAFPILGNGINMTISAFITECIGFTTYKLLSNGESLDKLLHAKKRDLIKIFFIAKKNKKEFMDNANTVSSENINLVKTIIEDQVSSILIESTLSDGELNTDFITSICDKIFNLSDKIASLIMQFV